MRVLNSASIKTLALFAPASEGSEEEPAYDAKAIKAAYKEATGKALPIKNDLLVQLLEQHPDFDDMETEAQIAFLSGLAEQVKGIAVADPAISELVSKIDTEAEQEILSDIDAVIKSQNSSMSMLRVMRRIYTREEILGMAFPGLEKAKMQPGDNRKPDIVVTKLKNGDEITTTWTDDFCSTWPPVKVWETDMDDAKKEKKTSGSVPRFKHLGKRELDNVLKLATKKRNAFRSMFKRALTLEHQLAAIEMMPAVVLDFSVIPAKDKVSGFTAIPIKYGLGNKLSEADCIKVTLAPSPFWMYPKAAPADGKPFSVTQINNMDVAAAIAAGGEMSDLTDTIAKGPDEDEETEGTGEDADIDEAFAFVSKAAHWFGKASNVANLRRVLANPKAELHDEWLQLIGELTVAILPTYRRYKAAYEKQSETVDADSDEGDVQAQLKAKLQKVG